jgi:hypothetical protein
MNGHGHTVTVDVQQDETAWYWVGGIAGDLTGSIINLNVEGLVSTFTSNTGGIVGRISSSDAHMENVTFSGVVNGFNSGGIVGEMWGGNIINAAVNAAIEGNSAGGISGRMTGGNLSHVTMNGNVTGVHGSGGIVGSMSQTGYTVGTDTFLNSVSVVNAVSFGTVTGNSAIGGITGANNGGIIIDSTNNSEVKGVDSIGGVAGVQHNGTINNVLSSGNVYGENFVGGLVGDNWGLIINSSATGNVTSTYPLNIAVFNVGGVTGRNGGNEHAMGIIRNTTSSGIVTPAGDNQITGRNDGIIE